MSRTGRAAVLHAYGTPLEIHEYPVPEPGPGALVVEIEVATVCASDAHAWHGDYDGVLPVQLPVVLGHEAVGRVVALGAGAERDSMGEELRVGDRVVWTPEPCLHCWTCTVEKDPASCPDKSIGMFTSSDLAPHFHGTFAEYGHVPARSGRVRVPDEVESGWASAASCAMRTVVKALDRLGRIDPLDDVVVQGAGPLGLFATALLSTAGPRQIIVVGAPDERLAVAEQWGATSTISVERHPDAAERIALVRERTGSRGASVVIEVAGVAGVVAEGIEMAARNGRYLVVGSAAGAPEPIAIHRIVNRGLSVFGSFSGGVDAYYRSLQFLRRHRGRFDWDLVLGARYPLDRVTDALDAMRHHRDIKPVITTHERGRP